MARTGRPSIYTPALADEIARRCVMDSLHKVCQADDMPAESTVYQWLIRHPDFAAKYARAREARAFRRAESVDEIMAEVKAGKLDSQAARVLLDAIKWQTAKENPRQFGDKIEHTGPGGGPITILTAVPEPSSEPEPSE